MIFFYIKTAFKNLWNNKKFSLINILGFSFSLSISLAIILFVIHEKSFNSFYDNYKYIYRLTDTQENSSSIDYRVKDILTAHFGEISKGCLYQQVTIDVPVTYNQTGYYINHIASADQDFLSIFNTFII